MSASSALGYLLPEAKLDLPSLAAHMRKHFPEATISEHPDGLSPRVRVEWGGWVHSISLVVEDWAVEECKETAARRLKKAPKDAKFKRLAKDCVGRLEIPPNPDPDDGYNNWLLICEFLATLPGVLVYDPDIGEWMG